MNLVALLIAPSVVTYSANTALRAAAATLAAAIVVAAIIVGKRRSRAPAAAHQTPAGQQPVHA